ncbi:uncharacterized protein LOC127720760 [Mytilus californianus]|uniref:uncharacterized protein LOC127720760 n=1 Tax=Mytilus californianus TaxID=6549 RepID=UPI0022485861|nr:uncharacterized protein LOC127720760 [Mytilus californianus]
MKLIHVIIWGIPGVITLTAYFYDKLGNGTYSINGGRRFNRNVLQWNQISNELRREDEIYCISCLIIYCLRLWGIIRLILGFVRKYKTFHNNWYDHVIKQALLYLHSYGDSAQAFWNFILFCVCDKTVRSRAKR